MANNSTELVPETVQAILNANVWMLDLRDVHGLDVNSVSRRLLVFAKSRAATIGSLRKSKKVVADKGKLFVAIPGHADNRLEIEVQEARTSLLNQIWLRFRLAIGRIRIFLKNLRIFRITSDFSETTPIYGGLEIETGIIGAVLKVGDSAHAVTAYHVLKHVFDEFDSYSSDKVLTIRNGPDHVFVAKEDLREGGVFNRFERKEYAVGEVTAESAVHNVYDFAWIELRSGNGEWTQSVFSNEKGLLAVLGVRDPKVGDVVHLFCKDSADQRGKVESITAVDQFGFKKVTYFWKDVIRLDGNYTDNGYSGCGYYVNDGTEDSPEYWLVGIHRGASNFGGMRSVGCKVPSKYHT